MRWRKKTKLIRLGQGIPYYAPLFFGLTYIYQNDCKLFRTARCTYYLVTKDLEEKIVTRRWELFGAAVMVRNAGR